MLIGEISDINGLQEALDGAGPVKSVNGNVGEVTLDKADLGLPNVDNVQQQPLSAELTAIAALAPAENDFIQRKGGVWVKRTPDEVIADLYDTFHPRKQSVWFDDFINGYVSGGIVYSLLSWGHGAKTPSALLPPVAGHPGVLKLTSGTTNLDRALLILTAAASDLTNAVPNVLSNQPNLKFRTCVSLLEWNTTGKIARIGLMTYPGSDSTWNLGDRGIFFRVDDNGHWFTYTQTSAGNENKDTGVSLINGYQTLEFRVNADGTSIDFYINDVLVTTHTNYIPSRGGAPYFYIAPQGGVAATRSLLIDYMYLSITGLAR